MSILITRDTTVIIQGITGREAVTMTREGLDYGTKIVGGVTPGRGGREVHGVPVYDTVEAATSKSRVDASVISVPPAFTRDAAFEALEAAKPIPRPVLVFDLRNASFSLLIHSLLLMFRRLARGRWLRI